jgi:hypothetical protein
LKMDNLTIFDLKTQRWKDLLRKGLNGFPSWSKDGRFIYFLRTTDDRGIYRVPISGADEERIVDLKDFRYTGGTRVVGWVLTRPMRRCGFAMREPTRYTLSLWNRNNGVRQDRQLTHRTTYSPNSPATKTFQIAGFWASDGQTAPYCPVVPTGVPCGRGALDLVIETASIQVARLGCTGRRISFSYVPLYRGRSIAACSYGRYASLSRLGIDRRRGCQVS